MADDKQAKPDNSQNSSPANNTLSAQIKELLGRVVPGHENELLWAGIGFVCALILLFVGFWQFLLILVFVIAGVIFGQYLDGKPRVLNTLKSWISSIRKD